MTIYLYDLTIQKPLTLIYKSYYRNIKKGKGRLQLIKRIGGDIEPDKTEKQLKQILTYLPLKNSFR